jgi:hypothetical protein
MKTTGDAIEKYREWQNALRAHGCTAFAEGQRLAQMRQDGRKACRMGQRTGKVHGVPTGVKRDRLLASYKLRPSVVAIVDYLLWREIEPVSRNDAVAVVDQLEAAVVVYGVSTPARPASDQAYALRCTASASIHSLLRDRLHVTHLSRFED